MLLIHWTKQNNTNDIIKNGITPTRRKNKDYDENQLKAVWCFPYTRNKTLNNNWKSNLKSWRKIKSNFNGFVFKLEEEDFPIYAGDWFSIGQGPKNHKFNCYSDFIQEYGKHFTDKNLQFDEENENQEQYIHYQDFEIIISNKIEAGRIVKIIKDRAPVKKIVNKYYTLMNQTLIIAISTPILLTIGGIISWAIKAKREEALITEAKSRDYKIETYKLLLEPFIATLTFTIDSPQFYQ